MSEQLKYNFDSIPATLGMLDDCLKGLNDIYPKFNDEYAKRISEIALTVIWDAPECWPEVFAKLERAWLMAEAQLIEWEIQKAQNIVTTATNDATAANNDYYSDSWNVPEAVKQNNDQKEAA